MMRILPPIAIVGLLASAPAAAATKAKNSVAKPKSSEPHEGSTGFQLALRTGAQFPMGDATGAPGDALSRRYAWQWPLAIDIGAKILPELFVGGYFGFAVGSTGSDSRLEADCDDDDENFENEISCNAASLKVGLEAHYSFSPSGRLNPWIGYGIGYESASAWLSDTENGYDETVRANGFTYAELSVGFDMRYRVGFGPYASAAIGGYTTTVTEIGGEKVHDGPIDDQALHAWINLGLRFVVNP
jgi:hypothetical protein